MAHIFHIHVLATNTGNKDASIHKLYVEIERNMVTIPQIFLIFIVPCKQQIFEHGRLRSSSVSTIMYFKAHPLEGLLQGYQRLI